MNSGRRNWLAIGLPIATWAATAIAVPDGVSETDYFAELPVVLSVSRLSQPLDEAPGAVTIIDREMIRLSGARHVTELLRFVPGFQVSDSFDALAPLASYHGGLSSFPNQMQVLIDGRSVYASYILGSVAPGLQSIDIDDVDHMEVLRGSNSAAYGARAFLGVVNIITHDPETTRGVKVVKRSGENGINDGFARIGWGNDNALFRISAGEHRDSGLTGAPGGNKVRNINLRADFHLSAQDEIELRAGSSEQNQQAGSVGSVGNAPRQRTATLSFVQTDWHRSFGADSDLKVSFSHGEEHYGDRFVYTSPGTCSLQEVLQGNVGHCFDGSVIDSGGNASNDEMSFQHTFRRSETVRVVWGAELRSEKVLSPLMQGTSTTFSTGFRRLFGNIELRPTRSLVVNAGGMYEGNSVSGSSFAPRLMANWNFTPDQTLRVGASRAYRPPSIYENNVHTTFVGAAFLVPLPLLNPQALVPVRPVSTVIVSAGNLHPEKLTASEVGYFGDFRKLRLTVDVRAFYEDLSDYIGRNHTIPLALTSPAIPNVPELNGTVKQFTNQTGFPIRGVEGQIQYQPRSGTRIIFNHASIRIDSSNNNIASSAPRESDGLTLFQKLPGGVDLSIMHQQASSAPWVSSDDASRRGPAWRRLDLRVGKGFLVGTTKGEIAMVVQNIGPAYADYPSNWAFIGSARILKMESPVTFERRAFLTFSLEM